jgi:ribonuclease E
LELSRQRLAPSLEESSYSPCPRCNGIGHIRGIESSALNILRIIQEEAMKESSAVIHAQVPVDVATFLLNEKRSDIHLIESRLKVSITLIPNPHMETPHYTVNRLRQDDITAEHLQASYKMVERPEETKPVTSATAQEVKAQRPQAAVKGITPAQPAPKHEAKKVESTSFFGKMFAWLFGPGEKNKPAAVPAKARPQNPRRERDSNRGERPEGAQQQGNRQRNKPRRDREETNAPRNENTQPPKTQQQEARPERPPRPPRPANVEKPVLETVKPVAATEQNAEDAGNQGRKRGRRGGRRERERRDQLAVGQTNGIENGVNEIAASEISTHVATVTAVASEVPVTAATSHLPEITPAVIEQTVNSPEVVNEVTTTPVSVAIEPVYTETVVTKPEAAEVITEPVQIAPELPSSPSISASLSEAGLVLIETDPNKAASFSPVPESREHAPRRRKRQREVYTAENSEPLVMIETQQHQ